MMLRMARGSTKTIALLNADAQSAHVDNGIRIDIALLRSAKGGPPKEFRVLKAGANESVYGAYQFTAESQSACMAHQSAKNGRETLIDWEHAAVRGYSNDPAKTGKAAGWCKLECRDGELWAVACRWTKAAKEAMTAEGDDAPEYRYFSPVFEYDRETRVIGACTSVGLTNVPALMDLPALAASIPANTQEVKTMLNPQLVAMLNLSAAATEGEMLLAVQAVTSNLSALLSAAGVKTVSELTATIAAWKANTEQLNVVQKEIAALTVKAAADQKNAVLEAALTAKKITPAERPFLEKMELADLTAYLSARSPAIASPAKEPAGGSPSAPSGNLTEALHKVAAMVGNTDLKKLEQLATQPIVTGILPGKVAPATIS
jgi:phage I-like protein